MRSHLSQLITILPFHYLHLLRRLQHEGETYEKGLKDWLERREAQARKRQQWAQRLKEE
jgi:hypothetical protein